jgi:eukaryotic-like serine/threonine-protein kinase
MEQGSGPASGSQRVAAVDPLIGQVFSQKFKILSLIARGGMGAVYKAEQAPLGRACAVKVLTPNLEDEQRVDFQRRFFKEASVAAKLTHPNAVTIYDYGRADDGQFFMAMELLDGQPLVKAVREGGPIPEDRAVHIGRQICRALREAHSLGVIHRDIKSANIFLVQRAEGEEDFVKVLDFGLVKDIDGDDQPAATEDMTQAGALMGSPKYMAPEQIQGEKTDGRTDIYALGVVLYEVMTGRVPFDKSTTIATLMAHMSEQPLPLSQANPMITVSPAFEQLILRCMAKSPDDRFSSIDEVLGALKRLGDPNQSAMTMTAEFSASSGPQSLTFSGPHVFVAGSTAPQGPDAARSTPPPAPSGKRKGLMVALGLAAALGGALLIHAQLSPPPAAALGNQAASATATAPSATATAAPAVSATPLPQPTASAPARVTFEVKSDPAGASVQLGDKTGRDLCEKTPCSVTLEGERAAKGAEHKLFLSKAGYQPSTITYRVGDTDVSGKLSRIEAPVAAPRPKAADGPYRNDPYAAPPPPY